MGQLQYDCIFWIWCVYDFDCTVDCEKTMQAALGKSQKCHKDDSLWLNSKREKGNQIICRKFSHISFFY